MTVTVPHTNHCPSPKLQGCYHKHYLFSIKIVKMNLDRKYPPRIISVTCGINGYAPLSLQPRILFYSQGYWLAELPSSVTNRSKKLDSSRLIVFDTKLH